MEIGTKVNLEAEHYKRGDTFWQNKQFEAAIAEFEQVVKINPIHCKAIFNLGYIYLVLARYEEALREFRLLVQLDPTDAVAYYHIGKLLSQRAKNNHSREDWSAAKEAYQKSLALSPNDADALDELAVVLLELGEFTEAARTSHIAVTLAPKDRRIVYNEGAIGGQIIRQYVLKRQWKEAWRFWMGSWRI